MSQLCVFSNNQNRLMALLVILIPGRQPSSCASCPSRQLPWWSFKLYRGPHCFSSLAYSVIHSSLPLSQVRWQGAGWEVHLLKLTLLWYSGIAGAGLSHSAAVLVPRLSCSEFLWVLWLLWVLRISEEWTELRFRLFLKSLCNWI